MKLILHLGAHRTGTTALQRGLQGRSRLLRDAGIGFWGPRAMRLGKRKTYISGMVRPDAARRAELAPVAAEFAAAFEKERAAGRKRLLISEENALGAMRDNYRGATLYADAHARLSALAGLFPTPQRIFLCVRDYADYAVSIHGHLSTRIAIGDFDADRLQHMGEHRGWTGVIGDIRSVFPDVRISVWRYAGRSAAVRGSIGAMLGHDLAQTLGDMPRGQNRSPSRFALIEIAKLRRDRNGLTKHELQKLAERFRDDLPGPRLEPFSHGQLTILRERFEADWEALATGAVAGVDIFDPLDGMEAET
ncbi:MAG: hypothetical protein WBB85_08765 [Albidovulum sp.]|uniref:hypothetical protein n=1 Tax=Albidovulum sp. TaxID=1872424 RepID=UPI003CB8AABE